MPLFCFFFACKLALELECGKSPEVRDYSSSTINNKLKSIHYTAAESDPPIALGKYSNLGLEGPLTFARAPDLRIVLGIKSQIWLLMTFIRVSIRCVIISNLV